MPDLSVSADKGPVQVSIAAARCTPPVVDRLRDVLQAHPGTTAVHLKLLNAGRATTLQTGRRSAGHPDVGADGRPQGVARRGLPGVKRRRCLGVCLVGRRAAGGRSGRSSRPGCPTRCSPTAGSARCRRPRPTTSSTWPIFTLSGMAIGILLAVGAWQFAAARGWQMVVTLVGGSLLGRADRLGRRAWLAPGVDPASVGATAADSIVDRAADHRHHPGRAGPTGAGRRRVHLPGRLERAAGPRPAGAGAGGGAS